MVKSVFFSQFRRPLSAPSNSPLNQQSTSSPPQLEKNHATFPTFSTTIPKQASDNVSSALLFNFPLGPNTSPSSPPSSSGSFNISSTLAAPISGNQLSILKPQSDLSFLRHLPFKKRPLPRETNTAMADVALPGYSCEKKKGEPVLMAEAIKKWVDLTQIERDQITLKGFAKRYSINRQTFNKCVTRNGKIRFYGQHTLSGMKREHYKKVTAEDIKTWCHMSQAERDKITFYGFAIQHQLNLRTWESCVTAKGIARPPGQQRIDKANQILFKNITAKDILTWCNMSQVERDQITLSGFATEHQLNFRMWESYVTTNGEMRPLGQQRVDKANGIKPQKTTANDIRAWCRLSQAERDQITSTGFAVQRHLNLHTWRHYVTVKGDVLWRGQCLLNKTNDTIYKKITADDIHSWCNMTQAERDQITFTDFAAQRHLSLHTWRECVTAKGAVLWRGQCLLNKTPDTIYKKITADDIHTWCNMSQAERTQIKLRGFAEQHGLNPGALRNYVTSTGKIQARGWHFFNTPTRRPINLSEFPCTDHPSPSPSAHEIDMKEVLSSSSPPPVQIITHEINNDAPILQDPFTGQSLTHDDPLLRPSKATWMALEPFLISFNEDTQKNIKRNIIHQIEEWIQTEGHHQQRFDDMLSTAIVVDHSASRGTSVFAKKMIAAFTVIGPYAGTLLPDQEALWQWENLHGAQNVQTYLFQAGPSSGPHRDRTISAFRTGNITSLINDAELGQPIWDKNGQALTNNLVPIRVNNKIFLISTRPILPEEELFLDYGPDYHQYFQQKNPLRAPPPAVKLETK